MSKFAGMLAIVGGAMLIIGGFTGYTMLDKVRDFADKMMPAGDARDNTILALNILIFFALLGGISVVIGGYLMWKDHDLAGKILVILGAGVGLTSLVVSAIVALATGKWDAFVASNMGLNGIGLILAAISRRLA